jgi:hypothetical protein
MTKMLDDVRDRRSTGLMPPAVTSGASILRRLFRIGQTG